MVVIFLVFVFQLKKIITGCFYYNDQLELFLFIIVFLHHSPKVK